MSEKTYDFVGLGYGGMDTYCVLPYVPLDEKVQIQSMFRQGGGPASTATVAAARLGMRTALVSAAGGDADGEEILRQLAVEGIDTQFVQVQANAASPVAYCWIDATSGSRSIAWSLGSVAYLEAEDIDPSAFADTYALHLDSHHPKAAMRAAEAVRAAGGTVFIDAGTCNERTCGLLPYCDVVIASEPFARDLIGRDEAAAAIQCLHERGAKWAGVTLGKQGSMMSDGQEIITLPIHPVEPIVDTTGAGDVFHGAFATRYVEFVKAGQSPELRECMEFATVVAGLKCRELGGRTAIPTRDEVVQYRQAE
jgi:sugar/nucleoside kinase (ribokinase family)